MMEIELAKEDNDTFLTELGDINRAKTITILSNQAVFHAVTKKDVFKAAERHDTAAFTFNNRYSAETFQGILSDTGAAGVSTAGEQQFNVLQRLDSSVQLDNSTTGQQRIRFGKGEAISLGTTQVSTPISTITFYVVLTNTPFLLCLQDMDKNGVKLDNIKNMLVKGSLKVLVIQKWGHPWMLLHNDEQSIAYYHLTENELKRLY